MIIRMVFSDGETRDIKMPDHKERVDPGVIYGADPMYCPRFYRDLNRSPLASVHYHQEGERCSWLCRVIGLSDDGAPVEFGLACYNEEGRWPDVPGEVDELPTLAVPRTRAKK